MKKRTLRMTMIALMTVITIICSQLIIPMTVPFTMQTFAVFAALRILGGVGGTASFALFLLMGAAGLPVFTGFQGGLGKLAGPTGGYLAGFLLATILYLVFEKQAERSTLVRWILMLAGLALCYAAGTAWFALKHANGRSVWAILGLCVFPFIIPDIIKILLADMVGTRVRKAIKKME